MAQCCPGLACTPDAGGVSVCGGPLAVALRGAARVPCEPFGAAPAAGCVCGRATCFLGQRCYLGQGEGVCSAEAATETAAGPPQWCCNGASCFEALNPLQCRGGGSLFPTEAACVASNLCPGPAEVAAAVECPPAVVKRCQLLCDLDPGNSTTADCLAQCAPQCFGSAQAAV